MNLQFTGLPAANADEEPDQNNDSKLRDTDPEPRVNFVSIPVSTKCTATAALIRADGLLN